MMGKVNALTYKGRKIEKSIITPVTVTDIKSGNIVRTYGIWDTGATGSVVTKSTAKSLGLIPVTKTIVNGVHGPKAVNVYYVRITLNNDQISLNSMVTECEELSADETVGMLIGMNVICLGDFSITNFENKTTMTFRTPSLEEVDFVDEINAFKKISIQHQSCFKHGNEKCPCGSGKLWKNCHGKSKYNK